jgi:arylsulfatase A-like enzyme
MRDPETGLHSRMSSALSRVFILALALAGFCGSVQCGGTTPAGDPPARPNIVFILVDDLGWTDVTPYAPHPDQYYEMPHITQLAGQGVTFTNAYTNSANCAPSRAALLSGQAYPNNPIYTVGSGARGKAKYRDLVPPENEEALPAEKITFAERLQDAGYTTGFMGKWHLGKPPEAGPKQQGYDVNVGGYSTGRPSWPGAYFEPANNPYIEDAQDAEYLTDFYTRKAVEFLSDHSGEPFYLQLSYYSVHSPLQAPDPRKKPFQRKPPVGGHTNATYAAMIESVDRGVGQIMDTLERLGVKEETIVVFYSDNGGVDGEAVDHWSATDNAPLRMGKGSFYEGGIRVPLIVRWPEVAPPGVTVDESVIGTDLYPTLLDAANVPRAPGYSLDGESLLPLLREPRTATLPRKHLYWHFPGYLNGNVQKGTWRTTPVSVVRSGKWKLLKFYEGPRLELYDLEQDVGESHNLADERPVIRRRLHEQLQRWLTANDAPMPKPKSK